jgi:hypothetical protein
MKQSISEGVRPHWVVQCQNITFTELHYRTNLYYPTQIHNKDRKTKKNQNTEMIMRVIPCKLKKKAFGHYYKIHSSTAAMDCRFSVYKMILPWHCIKDLFTWHGVKAISGMLVVDPINVGPDKRRPINRQVYSEECLQSNMLWKDGNTGVKSTMAC